VEIGGQFQSLDADRIDRRFTSATTAVTTIDAHVGSSAQAGWLSYRWTPSAVFVVSPGLRVERWGLLHHTAASPWLLSEWQLAPRTHLRGGIGIQRQAPAFDDALLVRSEDTVVPERARVIDLGLEQRIGESWRASATAYHRSESDRLRLVNGDFRLVGGRVMRPAMAYVDNVLEGTARGVEFLIERRTLHGLTGWLSYAWGEAQVTDVTTGERYWADFDQRHTLNVNVAYRWSDRTALSARYRYGSNFPIQGYIAPRGDIHVLTSERNVGRLPVYSRLDVRADRTFTFRKRRLTLFVEVVNVLDRNNFRAQSAQLDLRTGEIFGLTEKLFPLLPSAGVLIEF